MKILHFIDSSKEILEALARVISQPDWVIKLEDKNVLAIEDAGIHMCLKKLACLDKDKPEGTMGEVMCECLNDEVVSTVQLLILQFYVNNIKEFNYSSAIRPVYLKMDSMC